jgi:archaemetzincin
MSEKETEGHTPVLLLIAFGHTDGTGIIEQPVSRRFNIELHTARTPLPELRAIGEQVSADDLLSEVCRLRVAKKADIALGLTDADLFVPDMNFVFGLSSMDGACAVVSTNRLKMDGQGPYHDRLIKEAVHELGHLFGLRHCDDSRCVMHFSNSLRDTDLKSEAFCSQCSSQLLK